MRCLVHDMRAGLDPEALAIRGAKDDGPYVTELREATTKAFLYLYTPLKLFRHLLLAEASKYSFIYMAPPPKPTFSYFTMVLPVKTSEKPKTPKKTKTEPSGNHIRI